MSSVYTHNGLFTVTNPNTGNHRTFRIVTQPENAKFAPNKRIVSVFRGTGNDNPFHYEAFGFVTSRGVNVPPVQQDSHNA